MGDLSLTLSGVPFEPIGFSTTLSYGSIPTVQVTIDPTQGSICDIDQYRRKEVSLNFSSPTGCFKFDGLFDGLSITQATSGFAYTAIIKSKWQLLAEVYAGAPGFLPIGGANPFTISPIVSIPGLDDGDSISLALEFNNKTVEPSADENIVSFYVRLLADVLRNQLAMKDLAVGNSKGDFPTLYKLLIENSGLANKISEAAELIDSIDTSAVAGGIFKAKDLNNSGYYESILESASSGTILDNLLTVLGSFGCTVLFGNNKAFVVPISPFVRAEGSLGGVGQVSSQPNIITPASFNSMNVNNSGYKDIGSCYLYFRSSPSMRIATSMGGMEAGVFIDPEAPEGAGVLVKEVPEYTEHTIETATIKRIYNELLDTEGPNHTDTDVDIDEMTSVLADADKEDVKKIAKTSGSTIRNIFDPYAQSLYYQAKYADRTGSVNCLFNPNLCPATSGKIFSRKPSQEISMFVQTISHNVQISPDGGSVQTSVGFGYALPGSSISISSDDFYGYTSGKMKAVQDAYIGDFS